MEGRSAADWISDGEGKKSWSNGEGFGGRQVKLIVAIERMNGRNEEGDSA